MHFIELQGADHLVRFWLEAEGFRSTSWSRVRAQSLNSVKHSSLAEPVPSSPDGYDPCTVAPHTHDTLSQDSSSEGLQVTLELRDSSSTGPGLRSADTPTDTPTRQAQSRTGTPIKVQSNSTMRDLSVKLMKSKLIIDFFFQFVCLIIRDTPHYWYFQRSLLVLEFYHFMTMISGHMVQQCLVILSCKITKHEQEDQQED